MPEKSQFGRPLQIGPRRRGQSVLCRGTDGTPLNAPPLIKVVRCCLEHAASVAKTFLTSDVVVVDIKEPEHIPARNPMDNSGYGY
ncbi:ruBisCO large subunit-binding protein subunit beta, chloroplastic-like isoform X3 [Asparagus officinalis]|uniref:ruBisCO large subunit-binding protein subunit beta, chloroplastic-like isoform X3 n=1 Tax=Asparagus officinalis TaxID=4686 RepID=UPI00098E68C0|nr:ruBisCO large subunit-binding protein subunit beta, chloroplastic-like isoform X3 [Asparagus officinalis]